MNEMRKLMETLARIDENSNEDIVRAYDDEEISGRTRNLDIRGEPVSRVEWFEIMRNALDQIGGDYNDFEPIEIATGLGQFPGADNFTYTPARESSVAVYVHGDPIELKNFGSFILKNRNIY